MIKIVNLDFCQKYKFRLLLNYFNNRYLNKTSSILCITLVLFFACNPTRDRWLNRKWHSMTGHYNIYFNGELKLNDAIATLKAGHANDFNKILDVFPYGDEAAAKGVTNILDEAMKKFSGSVQLHQVGSYTDESWFAIAKTHFFKRDYYASQEALQFMINKYPVEYKNISTAWLAKTYLGLKKVQEAEAVIGLLLSTKNIQKRDIAEIYATAAEVNIKLEKYKSAIENLNKVLAEGKIDKETRIRYNYILGQLNVIAENKEKALIHFNKTVSLLPAYDFAFNATINITKLYDVNDKKAVNRVRRSLKRMGNDDKNIDYLDQIYFELGRLELSQKNIPPAINAFKLSIAKSTKNQTQKAKSYYELAKLYFDIKNYKNAKSYYDSTAMLTNKTDKQYETINSTKTVLNELINNITVYETEDSLQQLSKLSKNDLNKKVTDWILADNKRKELAAKEAKKRKQIELSNQNNPGNFGVAPGLQLPPSNGASQWYFYNASLMSNGAAEFFSNKKWGMRVNEDFWRIAAHEKTNKTESSKDSSEEKNGTAENKETALQANNVDKDETKVAVKYFGDSTKDAWVSNVPFTKDAFENSNLNMMEALHNLGLIYYGKIKNYKEALNYFNILENKFPKSDYEPEAWYYMHKSHEDLKETKNAKIYKDDLLKQYPENPYSLLLQGKSANTAATDQNKDLVALYDKTFEAYKAEQFLLVKQLKQEADKKYPGNNFRPKFEFINALAIGKTENVDAFKLALTNITTEFPKTDVADQSTEILNILNRSQKRSEVVGKDTALAEFRVDMEPDAPHYYIMAIKDEKANFTEYVEAISKYNDAYASLDNLRVNAIMSNEGYQILMVREFSNQKKAEEYYKGIVLNGTVANKLKVKGPYVDFVISNNNYKKILKDKEIEKYDKFYKKIKEKQNP